MLLLLADSFLMLFITFRVGVLARHLLEKFFRVSIRSDLFGVFLGGLIACSLYFNLLSIWLPVNYLLLIPLIILSLAIGLFLREKDQQIRHSIGLSLKYIFSPANLFISLCLIATLFIFWIIPPGNDDSAGYHYLSILWYEKYKAVPGLANLHGRLAFNNISFIIQSAYSFTGPAGQSIYPLNGVIIGLFSSWLLLRILRARRSPLGLVYAVLLILLYRALLINLSSPSPDALVDVCMAYSMIFLLETLLTGQIVLSKILTPCLIIAYSLMAKLYSFPLLLVAPFLFYFLPKNERKGFLVLKFFAMCVLIFGPWMIRNYILSGYIIYPLPWFNFLHPDWQVSFNILKHDFWFVHGIVPSPTEPALFFSWVVSSVRGAPVNTLLTIAAVLSPLCWIPFYKKTRKKSPEVFGIWAIVYIGIWIWIFTSPVFRFGAILIFLSLLLPFLAGLYNRSWGMQGLYSSLISLLFVCTALYYIKTGSGKPTTYAFGLKDCWLYPLKDGRYRNNKADFPYKTMRSGVRLYLEDSAHECINTELTCRLFYTGEIEMRGARIDQGFKTVKDETLPYYPFIK